MKKAKIFWVLFFITIITVSAYDNNGTLRLSVNNNTIQEEVEAYMDFFGTYYSNNAANVDITLVADNMELYFEMFVPIGNNRLIDGTYNISSASNNYHRQFTFSYGEIYLDDYDDDYYEVTGGSLTVTSSGQGANITYNIDFNLTLEDDYSRISTATGSYRGTFVWEDYSRDWED